MKLCLNCQRINMDAVEQCIECGNSQFSPVWFDPYIAQIVVDERRKMKIIDFKTVSPLFEMERDGEKPFTTRRYDGRDTRFRKLSQWSPGFIGWGIRITNPQTGEQFIREMLYAKYLRVSDKTDWILIRLGRRLE